MYLEHFKIVKHPFSLTPNTDFFCELPSHQEALNVLRVSLNNGEGFVKIIGEVGTGKTLLCRLLLSELKDEFITAYIPNPDLTPEGFRLVLAQELGVEATHPHTLVDKINYKLLEYKKQGKAVVLIVDEAQALSDECLEAVRLLTNLETEDSKLLQVVLFGQPELDIKLSQHNLRQLAQRITFSYHLGSLKEHELNAYLCHRLARSGYTYGSLFSKDAQALLYKATKGLPRLINIVSHKAMMAAYGKGQTIIDKKAVKKAIKDTQSISLISKKYGWIAEGGLVLLLGIAMVYLIYQRF